MQPDLRVHGEREIDRRGALGQLNDVAGWREDEKENEDQASVPPSSQARDDQKKVEEDEGDAHEDGEGNEEP